MKQFIVDRHTTPNTPTLEQVPTEKIPIYENRAAVTADLANLSVGQIVATKDTGDELAQPVDVVEEDNLHAVTSNAVAESLSYSTTEQKTGGVWIDGKPIYRKVIETTFDNVTTAGDWYHATSVGDTPNVAQYTQIKAIINTLSNVIIDVNGDYVQEYGAYYHFQSSYTNAGGSAKIILEYTKTTD